MSIAPAFVIPPHLLAKMKKREVTRDVFMKALLELEVGTMLEIPDSQYKYNTVRGRVSEANKKLRGMGAGKMLITSRQNGSPSTMILCGDC